MEKQVILVDENDTPTGVMEKLRAHQEAALHRAFSIFIFNSAGQLLIQQRATQKYHCGGLWSNTCCSHPEPDESTDDAATKRLKEEMGLVVRLKKIFEFTYRADVGNGLTEYEFDHVYAGVTNESPKPDPMEVSSWKWVSLDDLRLEMNEFPERFTPWFAIAMPILEKNIFEKQLPVS